MYERGLVEDSSSDSDENIAKLRLRVWPRSTLSYARALELQHELQQSLVQGGSTEHILFVEHPPVLTYGAGCALEQALLAPERQISDLGISLQKTNRGGNVTYHGPGQLVCYLILDLRRRKTDVAWYLRTLEQGILDACSALGINSLHRVAERTGIWHAEKSKIASIGIRVSRWCTMHGVAINVTKESLRGFKVIHPCGLEDARAGCLEMLAAASPKSDLMSRLEIQLTLAYRKLFFEDFALDLSN